MLEERFERVLGEVLDGVFEDDCSSISIVVLRKAVLMLYGCSDEATYSIQESIVQGIYSTRYEKYLEARSLI
jgi:hypothetical protein